MSSAQQRAETAIAWPMVPARREPASPQCKAADFPAPMLSPMAVAVYLGVCTETVCREIRSGVLRAIKVRGQWRVSEEALARYQDASEWPLRLYSRSRSQKRPS